MPGPNGTRYGGWQRSAAIASALLLAPTYTTAVGGRISQIAGIPRPEPPRPDFFRRDWRSLNGPWQFELDDADRGVRDRREPEPRSLV